jgi:hypothetical protein
LGVAHHVKVWQKLENEDKKSLSSYNISDIVAKYGTSPVSKLQPRKIRIKQTNMKFCEEFMNDANANAAIYPYVYVLENSLRKVILTAFKNETNWWVSKAVHPRIRAYAERIQLAEKKYRWVDKRGGHPIYYVCLEHLLKIIEMNWGKFKGIFDDLNHLKTWIEESVPVRHLIAHNIKTKPQEKQDIVSAYSKICKLIDDSKEVNSSSQ